VVFIMNKIDLLGIRRAWRRARAHARLLSAQTGAGTELLRDQFEGKRRLSTMPIRCPVGPPPANSIARAVQGTGRKPPADTLRQSHAIGSSPKT